MRSCSSQAQLARYLGLATTIMLTPQHVIPEFDAELFVVAGIPTRAACRPIDSASEHPELLFYRQSPPRRLRRAHLRLSPGKREQVQSFVSNPNYPREVTSKLYGSSGIGSPGPASAKAVDAASTIRNASSVARLHAG
jgi:hypothetical protein